jgi:phosphofructokinase-like protein
MEPRKRIGILTGGGDCPGLNAAIRATAKAAFTKDYEVLGIHNGWKGLIDVEYEQLDRVNTSGIIDRGGTILGSSRVSPLKIDNGAKKVFKTLKELKLDALVVLGGEGTLSLTSKLYSMGLPVIGIPKTIDNDVVGTSFSIGFQTAVQIATDALDRLRSTAESHHRVMVLEVMGRNVGWIATYAGMANGADAILIPEIPMDEKKIEDLCEMLVERNRRGASFSIIVVAEGTILEGKTFETKVEYKTEKEFRPVLGGVGHVIGDIIQKDTGMETRVTTLGYVQRGGTPVAYDRSLATAFGVKAISLIEENTLGRMTALKGNKIVSIPLSEVEGKMKKLSLSIYKVAEVFFG